MVLCYQIVSVGTERDKNMLKVNYFDKTAEGDPIYAVSLQNKSGAYVQILTYGAIVRIIKVPDKDGALRDIALGYDNVEDYRTGDCYFGAVIGRCANRLTGPSFTLNGKTYHLFDNTGTGVALHGGKIGFDKKVWTLRQPVVSPEALVTLAAEDGGELTAEGNEVCLSMISQSGDEGYPGNLTLDVTYSFSEDNTLALTYCARCDQDTILNVTNHSYFNLDGQDCGHDCLDTLVRINADEITPLGSDFAPTGEFMKVKDSAYDFNTFKTIRRDLESGHPQLIIGGGYDQNFVIRGGGTPGTLTQAAEAVSKESGIKMEVYTDLPGVQFYIGNFIAEQTGKNGAVYNKRSGFCFETQKFPNAVNIPHFPSVILRENEVFTTTTHYCFGISRI